MMKKLLLILFVFASIFSLAACGNETKDASVINEKKESVDYSGTYIGYSWKKENKGTALEDAEQKIKTILTLDKEGIIVDAQMLFWKKSEGYWYTRQDGTSKVSVDMTKTPVAATLGDDYAKGNSMFAINTHDLMSFYAAKVATGGTVALAIVEPFSRYQFEIKMPTEYDYSTLIKDVTINGNEGGFIPTERTSKSGLFKPKSLTEFDGMHIFNVHGYFNVMSERGVFKGLNKESTMQELLEAIGVEFVDGKPQETDLITGFHSNGGWAGNYAAIEDYLIGKNATELTSLVDWSVDRWAKGVNKDNFFGVDIVTGATKTVQDSTDAIAGATVRMSRESTSYQRALVNAGILEENEVIKGRF